MKKKHTKDSRRRCVSSPLPPFPVPIHSEQLPLLPRRDGIGKVAVMVPMLNVIIISKKKERKKKKHTKGLETHMRLESPIPFPTWYPIHSLSTCRSPACWWRWSCEVLEVVVEGMKERKNSGASNKYQHDHVICWGWARMTWKRFFFKSFEPTLNRSHDHVDIFDAPFFLSFVPPIYDSQHLTRSPPPTFWGVAGWQGMDWKSSREGNGGLETHVRLESFGVCFFFFLSFFLLLIIITLSMWTTTATLPIPTRWGSSGNRSERMGTGNGGRVRFFFLLFSSLIIVLTSLVWEPPLSLANVM